MLQRVVHTYVWGGDRTFWFLELRQLLNVSCDELRAAICRLRPIFAEYVPDLVAVYAFIQDSMTPSKWRAIISIDLAFGYIRVRRLIETGYLPDRLAW